MATASRDPGDPQGLVVPRNFPLTEFEVKLFEFLRQIARTANHNTTLRVVGGWVRDKLLGKHSEDIDIALDNMLGREFAEAINSHLKAQGLPTNHVGLVQANPDKCKHLETASMKISGTFVDFVNLRTEEYSDKNSRIPSVMHVGTPVQDAMRRDFTINALFYNLELDSVEDFTGQGLADLKKGVLRTPMAATETFLDDPLRILRAVRFSARLQFELDEGIVLAAKNIEIQNALKSKVTRDRIGKEVDSVLKGPDPLRAFQQIHQLSLDAIVFKLPPPPHVFMTYSNIPTRITTKSKPIQKPQAASAPLLANQKSIADRLRRVSPLRCAETVGIILDEWKLSQNRMYDRIVGQQDDWAAVWVCGYTLPYFCLGVEGNGQVVSVATEMLKHHLRLRGEYFDMVDLLHMHLSEFMSLANRIFENDHVSRAEMGTLVRRLGTKWPCGLFIATVAQHVILESSSRSSKSNVTTTVLSKYDKAIAALLDTNIDDVIELRPFLTGKALESLLGIEPGKQFGTIREAQLMWRMEHPELDETECIEWLKRSFAEIKS